MSNKLNYFAKKGDAKINISHICSRDGVNPVNLTGASSVKGYLKPPTGSVLVLDNSPAGEPTPAFATDRTTGEVTLTSSYNSVTPASILDAAGTWTLELEVVWSGSEVERFPKQGTIVITVEDKVA